MMNHQPRTSFNSTRILSKESDDTISIFFFLHKIDTISRQEQRNIVLTHPPRANQEPGGESALAITAAVLYRLMQRVQFAET